MSRDLFAGVTKRSLKAIRIAIEAGADVNAVDEDDGCTALHLLCKSRSGVMSRNEVIAAMWLLDHGADATRPTKCLETPLHLAVASGSHEMIDVLIARGATITRDRWGNTPLHRCLSSHEKDTWIWDRLVALGCALDDHNDAGETPLHRAQLSWNAHAVRYLIDKGASRDAKDAAGKTALDRANDLAQATIIAELSR